MIRIAFCQTQSATILEGCRASYTDIVSVCNFKLISLCKKVTLLQVDLLFQFLRVLTLLSDELSLPRRGLTPQCKTNQCSAY